MTTAFRDDKGLHEELVESIPQGRGCDPKEVSRAILFLASDEASYVNGHGKFLSMAWYPILFCS
jgi:NAD(P)-dependent dehydrogenase (short-subunit alcohol dehydrogenase family)